MEDKKTHFIRWLEWSLNKIKKQEKEFLALPNINKIKAIYESVAENWNRVKGRTLRISSTFENMTSLERKQIYNMLGKEQRKTVEEVIPITFYVKPNVFKTRNIGVYKWKDYKEAIIDIKKSIKYYKQLLKKNKKNGQRIFNFQR